MFAIRSLLFVAAAVLIPLTHTIADNGMGSLTVTVKDFRRGTPIEGARILITPCNYSGTTGSGGTLLFAEVTPFRNYQVDVDADGYIHGAAGFVAVAAEDKNELVIPLKQTSILRGQVTAHLLFGLIRWPLRDATVKLQQEIDGSFITRGETQTDILGRYRFADLDEGEFRISARAEGFATASADITVDGGKRIIRNLSLLPQQEESTAAYGNESAGQSCCGGKTAYRSAAVTSDPCTVSAKQPVITNQGYFTPPEAVASVIPGPSELPYIYNNGRVLASSNGSRFVAAGTPVFLRGFAIDPDLPSPQEFNPDAPCFDIYENKNGNFSASIFSYRWTLMSSGGEDVSSLLQPSATEENVFFTVPEDAQPGDVLTASLVVTDDLQNASIPLGTTIVVSESVDDAACYECHRTNAAGYEATAHAAVAGGAGCQDCHGLGSEHNADPSNAALQLSTSYWPGTCGQCHVEFAELQKANHSDPLPFGYYEPSSEYLLICFRCHYTPGYIGAVESDKPFHEFRYESQDLSSIPKDTPNVSCSVCHDPHPGPENAAPFGLRTGSKATACDTCHYEKWQNAILEGRAGEFGNGYHYPGEDYTPFLGTQNYHRGDDKCVTCHMSTTGSVVDEKGVLKTGGHTFRMRDFGPDAIPETGDDTLNIAACANCHPGASSFDINGLQTEIQSLTSELFGLLTVNNSGFLPANEPGNCARCHKGGTVPFLNDPDQILENAYTNYKLIVNDRSKGVHNPGYVKKLLQDSIQSIKNDYRSAPFAR